MCRRRRTARERSRRLRVARAKVLRRRGRNARRTASVATVVAAALTGAVPAATPSSVPPHPAAASVEPCGNPRTTSSGPEALVAVGDRLFFTAEDGLHGRELWVSDGTSGGTTLVRDIGANDGGYQDPWWLTPVGDTVFFTDEDDVHGRELWKSDGTPGGTVLVKDIARVDAYYEQRGPGALTAVGSTLFFGANAHPHPARPRHDLWKSDGTRAGTVLVKDHTLAGPAVAVGATMFLVASDRGSGAELWKSDGTASGTVRIENIRPGRRGSDIEGLAALDDTVFFGADDGVHGRELWKSDGTPAGTVLVEDIRPGSYGSEYSYTAPTVVGDTVYFTSDDGIHGSELWRSDGTEAGTVMVKDIDPTNDVPSDSAAPRPLAAVAGRLFLVADDGVHGPELWTSDGTDAGTVMVKDAHPGAKGSRPMWPAVLGDELFFTANDGVHGRELWRSDGTEAGTTQVQVDDQDRKRGGPQRLTTVGDTLFFADADGVHGRELWISDGTEDGTRLVEDIHLGGGMDVPARGVPDTSAGTMRLRVRVDTAGTLQVGPVAGAPIKRTTADAVSAQRVPITLTPTRAGLRELRRSGELRVRARFTFTTCGGAVASATQRFTLRLR